MHLAPAEPEDVFARANFLENGCDLDIQVSVRLADGVIASFSGHGHQPWVIRHGFDLKIAGEEGVLLLDMQRVHAELLLQGDKERGEVLHVGPEPPPRDEEGDYSCDGPAQFLIDTCLGRDDHRSSVRRARHSNGRCDGGGLGVGALRCPGGDRPAPVCGSLAPAGPESLGCSTVT